MVIKDGAIESTTDDCFRAILEQSPLSIQIMSPEGRILRVNRAWEELWGVTLEQLEGYNILEDRQLVENGIMPYIRRAFTGEAVEMPPVLYDPDATIPHITRHAERRRWTKAVAYPIKDEAGRVREVVLMHEDITARVVAEQGLRESEGEGRGATFIIELPAAGGFGDGAAESQQLSASLAEVAAAVSPVSQLADLRVLIVDDEADARLLLKKIMEQSGAKVRAASSASEAMTALKEFRPDILLSDIGMPQEDGYALLRRVRALSAQEGGMIPAVALTAYAQEDDRMRALLAGFQVHVAKPINPPEFVAVIVGLAGVTSRK